MKCAGRKDELRMTRCWRGVKPCAFHTGPLIGKVCHEASGKPREFSEKSSHLDRTMAVAAFYKPSVCRRLIDGPSNITIQWREEQSKRTGFSYAEFPARLR